MRGWLLQDGDLVLGGAGFAEITGPDKIAQDLNVAALEPFGCDIYHPSWGSLLVNYIGQPVTSATQAMIQAEVTRLINNYMTVQTTIVNQAQNNGVKSPYNVDDLVAGISSITVNQSFDTFTVSVVLKTGSNQTVVLNNTVTPQNG